MKTNEEKLLRLYQKILSNLMEVPMSQRNFKYWEYETYLRGKIIDLSIEVRKQKKYWYDVFKF